MVAPLRALSAFALLAGAAAQLCNPVKDPFCCRDKKTRCTTEGENSNINFERADLTQIRFPPHTKRPGGGGVQAAIPVRHRRA